MEREGSFSKEDNRRSREELEIAQKHLIDIIERSLPYMTEEMQRATKADLQNVNKDLRLKDLYRSARRRLEDLNASPTGSQRREDKEEIDHLLKEMNRVPVD